MWCIWDEAFIKVRYSHRVTKFITDFNLNHYTIFEDRDRNRVLVRHGGGVFT